MADFKVNPEELKQTAGTLRTKAGTFADAMNAIINSINNMSVWTGSARDEFINKATSMQQVMVAYNTVLESYAQKLEDIATEYFAREGVVTFDEAVSLDDSNLIHQG